MSERREPTLADVVDLIHGIGAGLGSLREDVTRQLTEFRTVLMERMDRLQDAITAIRDDIGATMTGSERAQEAADHTRDELRLLGEQVTVMARQIQRLQTDVRQLKGEP
jgi:hypothetical protein